jgi:hypothetical protein
VRQVWNFLTRTAACWRLVELVTIDEVARPPREAIAKRWPGSRVAYLVQCPRCVSVWAAAVVLILPEWLTRVLAFSAVTIAADEWRDHAAQRALATRMAAARGTVREQGEGGQVQRT